jgi:hypothetical protein
LKISGIQNDELSFEENLGLESIDSDAKVSARQADPKPGILKAMPSVVFFGKHPFKRIWGALTSFRSISLFLHF